MSPRLPWVSITWWKRTCCASVIPLSPASRGSRLPGPVAVRLIGKPDRVRLDDRPDVSALEEAAVQQWGVPVLDRGELREVPDVHDLFGNELVVLERLSFAQIGEKVVVYRRLRIGLGQRLIGV